MHFIYSIKRPTAGFDSPGPLVSKSLLPVSLEPLSICSTHGVMPWLTVRLGNYKKGIGFFGGVNYAKVPAS